jgi:hypothetical protein
MGGEGNTNKDMRKLDREGKVTNKECQDTSSYSRKLELHLLGRMGSLITP